MQEILFNTIDKSFQNSKLHLNTINENGDLKQNGDLKTNDKIESMIIEKQHLPQQSQANQSHPTWHLIDNPFMSLCDISEINQRAPPLFALRFPNLFVY